MIAVGNDIVALDRRSGRSREPIFYSKIIKPAEKDLFSAERVPHLAFEHFVWLCWAVKEAAFKCINRANPGSLFWGPRITITDLSPLDYPPGEGWLDAGDPPCPFYSYQALARFGSHRLQAWAIATGGDILAVSTGGDKFCPADFSPVYWGIRRGAPTDRDGQSAGVRAFTLEKLEQLLPDQSLNILTAASGFPILACGPRPLDCSVSFSHHGDWLAYAFRLPAPQ